MACDSVRSRWNAPGWSAAVTEVGLPVPCTYDLEVASARYLHGLDDGTIPLIMLFSGTVFVANGEGYSVELVPWSSEATYRMPVTVWQDLVDIHFPGSAWLRCSHQTLDALSAFKAERALPTWDATLTALLAEAVGARGAEQAREPKGPPAVIPEPRHPSPSPRPPASPQPPSTTPPPPTPT